MPTDVGNAIYQYIKHGCPDIDAEFIFIRHKAPYKKVSTKLCNKALYSILPLKIKFKVDSFGNIKLSFYCSRIKCNKSDRKTAYSKKNEKVVSNC